MVLTLCPAVWCGALVGSPGEESNCSDHQRHQPEWGANPDLHPQHGFGQHYEHADGCQAFAAQAQGTDARCDISRDGVASLGEEGVDLWLQAAMHVGQEDTYSQ